MQDASPLESWGSKKAVSVSLMLMERSFSVVGDQVRMHLAFMLWQVI